MTYNVETILEILTDPFELLGNKEDKWFSNVKPIKDINAKSLDWINPDNPNKQEIAISSKANIIICDKSIDTNEGIKNNKCFIVVENPKLTFVKVVNKLFVKNIQWGHDPSAIISKDASVHNNTYIGSFVKIGHSTIGEGSIIHDGCIIKDNVFIGNNVQIHSGSIIGTNGFGYVQDNNGENILFPHIGGIIIEDNVEIGSNTCIDRGSLGDTIIKEGAKIDNLVHIAHNVVIGKNSFIIANAMIGGSTIIGDSTWVAPSASLLNQIKIGDNVTLGVGSVVTKNVPDNETWAGAPAKELTEFIKIQKHIKSSIVDSEK
jgi:UDP-3-O-[3-hydroxymyristoyl] glucosamine N-acyltransferase